MHILYVTFFLLSRTVAVVPFADAIPQNVARQTGAPKLVVAHYIVGLTYGFTLDDWKSDISLAQGNGIDGFALNLGHDSYTEAQVANAYEAATQLNSDFKLFFSFDMTSYPCSAGEHAVPLRALTTAYASHSNQLMADKKTFVSSFAGENCNFGHDSAPEGWRSEFAQHPDLAGRIHFVPSFFVDPVTFSQYTGFMDGDFNFNSGWPIELKYSSASALLPGVDLNNIAAVKVAVPKFIGAFDIDNLHINNLASTSARTYMAAVSPWFFTHFGVDTYNKNFVYDADEHLWVLRWENLIANRDKVDIVQILSWNDFGESHYIGPQHGSLPPTSEEWVTGFDHQGWLTLNKHFAAQFKTGQAPAIEQDLLVMWARPHPKNATPNDPVGPPADYQLLQDELWAVVLATGNGEVTLSSSDTNAQTFPVTPGVNRLSLPLTPDGYMHGVLTRNGQTLIDLKPDNFTFNANPAKYNFNAFVAYAVSGPVDGPSPSACVAQCSP